MSNHDIEQQHHETFESIRHVDGKGNEYWLARELARILEYSEYRHFLPVIVKAKEACTNSNFRLSALCRNLTQICFCSWGHFTRGRRAQ